ncbi:MAG TPA: AzlD domain-containing protein [Burkholderiales bacterium]|nr:AzlD domain-containing protein [Burkholderiales bacterium]
MLDLWLLVIACAVATYVWRGLGVALSGRIAVQSELFNWLACVAYAMVAGLVARIVFMPSGIAQHSLLHERLIACAIALAVFYLTRRNYFLAVGSGVLVLIAFGYSHGLLQ